MGRTKAFWAFSSGLAMGQLVYKGDNAVEIDILQPILNLRATCTCSACWRAWAEEQM